MDTKFSTKWIQTSYPWVVNIGVIRGGGGGDFN